MNLLFVTQFEPFYIKYFFKTFLSKHIECSIKGIVIQKTLNQQCKLGIIYKSYILFGVKGFFYMGFKYLFAKIVSFISKYVKIGIDTSIEQVAKKHNIPILQFESVNTDEFLEFIKKEEINLVVSVAASEIFKDKILNLPKFGCINIHSSPLPKYRGMMPNFWTLYNNEEYAWVTIHKMVKKLDDGPILLQDKFLINNNETYNSLAKRSKEFAAKLLFEALEQINKGKVNYLPNDFSKATYYSFPTRDDIKKFKKAGGRII